MTEQQPPLEGKVVGSGVIAAIAAREARRTPGVLRLEPTVGRLVLRLRRAAADALRRSPVPEASSTADGISAWVIDGTAALSLDIATDVEFNALDVAAELQARITSAIAATGLAAGPVNITVLAIEPRTSPSTRHG